MSLADTVRHTPGPVRLRARWVVPVDMPPIENGEVVIEDGEIVQVGKQVGREPGVDLGLSAILPGFVNVHAHVEYTLLRGILEDMPFFPWVRSLTALKTRLSWDDWVASATLGAAEMLAAGITTIGDAADAGAALTALMVTGQRGVVFREVFGIDRETVNESVVSLLRTKVTAMRDQIERDRVDERLAVGISPHAPYTVNRELLPLLSAFAAERGLRQTIHAAESPAESDLVRHGTGPFAEMFTRRAIRWDTPGVSPVRYLADSGAFDAPTLAVHCVQTDEADAELLAEKQVAVAHCPKSNAKLGAGIAPVKMLRAKGVTVGLGTDSVVSNNAGDMFEEMRAALLFARAREQDARALTARDVLHMATLGGAKALGLDDRIGSLARGKRADLCVVRLDGLHIAPAAEDNVLGALVYAARASDVALTLVNGRVLYEQGRCLMVDTGRLRATAAQVRARLRREAKDVLGEAAAAAAAQQQSG